MSIDLEEQLFQEYQRTRTELEEEEDQINAYLRKGERYTQDLLAQLHHSFETSERSMDIFLEMGRELQRHEANYLEALGQERKALIDEQEELELVYRKKRQELQQEE